MGHAIALRALAAASLVALCACQTPAATQASQPSSWQGSLTATFSRLDGIPVTPSPMVATGITALPGKVTTVHAMDGGSRTVDIQVADTAPLAIGTTYNVVAPKALDTTGASRGAAISFQDAQGGQWTSTSGSLSIALVAGPQLGFYFHEVVMTPGPKASGGFNFDGQAETLVASPH